MKFIFPFLAFALIGCCQQKHGARQFADGSHSKPDCNLDIATNTSEFVTRTTVENSLRLTVRVQREAMIGSPCRVFIEFVNLGSRPVWLSYSSELRMAHPKVYWINMSGPMPLTTKGEKEFGKSHEEISTRTGALEPGELWRSHFDIAKYYDLSVAAPYILAISFRPELTDQSTGGRVPIRFDVGGLKFAMRSATR